MKLVICGCSYSAKSPNNEFTETHWSEILAKKLNAKLINLAVGGATNNFIRLQIDTAKYLKPDLIICSATTPNRLEIKNLNYKKFSIKKNLNNYTYKNFYWNSFTGKGNLIGLPIINILENKNNIPITEKQISIIDDYLNYVYDEVWKTQVDQYVLQSGLYELYYQKYNFLFNPYLLQENFYIDAVLKEKHFLSKSFDFNDIQKNYKISKDEDPGYHTSLEGQKFIAQKYYEEIINYNFNKI